MISVILLGLRIWYVRNTAQISRIYGPFKKKNLGAGPAGWPVPTHHYDG